MSKKNIIIVGYPKSGTSWLSRLVAELIQCEFLGDWGYDKDKDMCNHENFLCGEGQHPLNSKEDFSHRQPIIETH